MNRGRRDLKAAFEQFGGRCPVCGAPLGEAVRVDRASGRFETPPSFLLEIGHADNDTYSWRVQVLGGNFPPATSVEPRFVEGEVQYVFVLCGDGHVFPQSAPALHRHTNDGDVRKRVDRWNMVAAIGAAASGKTYLLIRMINQNLTNTRNLYPEDDGGRVERHHLNPLERLPFDLRSAEYAKTVSAQRAMQPTSVEETRPKALLKTRLRDAVEAIEELIHRTVLDGERRAKAWGEKFRQPLVIRTTSRNRVTWTGIADLPGELFTPDKGSATERAMLRSFDALIWVIDPAVSEALDDLAKQPIDEDGDYSLVLDGSLRPGTTAVQPTREVRAERARAQREIGENLTLLEGEFVADHGRPLELLVAVSKCDLIHAALGGDRSLFDLGEPDSVRRGAAAYLAATAMRFAADKLVPDGHSRRLLEYLYPSATVDKRLQRDRTIQVVEGLLAHYSNPKAFWRLVHTGQEDVIDIFGGRDPSLGSLRIEVPSLGEHQDQSTVAGSAEGMLIRDLIMSTVGCGVAYGLGHETALYHLMHSRNVRVRCFLCSPLVMVPVSRVEDNAGYAQTYRLEPLEKGASFPDQNAQSAALTQLLLASLRKARA